MALCWLVDSSGSSGGGGGNGSGQAEDCAGREARVPCLRCNPPFARPFPTTCRRLDKLVGVPVINIHIWFDRKLTTGGCRHFTGQCMAHALALLHRYVSATALLHAPMRLHRFHCAARPALSSARPALTKVSPPPPPPPRPQLTTCCSAAPPCCRCTPT